MTGKNGWLSNEDFANRVRLGTLPSIDLIISDREGQILVGERLNRPARGYLFVVGGSVQKNEDFYGEALPRISQGETGIKLCRKDVQPMGLYRHIYDDNFSGTEFGTDYFACGLKVIMPLSSAFVRETGERKQHGGFMWLDVPSLMNHNRVHENTKAYFEKDPKNLIFNAS